MQREVLADVTMLNESARIGENMGYEATFPVFRAHVPSS